MSGGCSGAVYGAVNGTSSVLATEHNKDPIGEKHCDTVDVPGTEDVHIGDSEKACEEVA